MKEHSQRLNIKTTQLASLTAVFRRRKRAPSVAHKAPRTAMDVGEVVLLPEHDSQVGDLEAIPREPAALSGGDETDDAGSSSGMEGSLEDLDSENEFESDEEDVAGKRDGARGGRGVFDFELRAAEAGNVLSECKDSLMNY